MGNSSSSGRGHQDESVDYGSLVPQGVYTGPRDWNQAIVSQLIVQRKLAPFYRPLEDYEDNWDDDQILAARKELTDPENPDAVTRIEATASSHHSGSKSKRPGALKEPAKPEAQVYRGAVECPICFLYYPPNINHSRCCDQAICTECFVQIKRAEPTTTHLVSEYAACPYCVQENFGVVYSPPPWRAGLGSDGSNSLWSDSQRPSAEPTTMPTHKRRQKSFGADSPEVVTTDQIRPDWEAKLEAVRAAVARRANRRIIMRQVGDRLIPVGVTSGRVHPLSPEEAAAVGADPGGRRSRRGRGQQNGGVEQFMGMAGQDLEELMLMEAMRLSMIDHEEHQRKEAEEKKKKAAAEAAAGGDGGTESIASGRPSTEAGHSPSPGPGPSTLDSHSSLPSSANLSLTPSSQSPSSSSSSHFKHNKVESQDSLTPGRKSWSLSRSRTPPPPNPAPNVPQSEENQAAWRNRATGPPAFSTLSAALTSTSTAAAVLGTSRSATPDPTSGAAASAPVTTGALSSSSSSTAAESVPKVIVVDNDADASSTSIRGHPGPSASQASDDTLHTAGTSTTASSPLPIMLADRDNSLSTSSGFDEMTSTSVASSRTSASDGIYGTLPSSPESAAQPLLTPSSSIGKSSPRVPGPNHVDVNGISR